ncbi:MAG TPA: GNAT family N-acetyltransferase [Roseiflexaceae bacterium]|nr:GNAT family N-acetyltransferase [Roseiflexaceae bacterium]
MSHSLGCVTRPFSAIGMQLWSQPHLNTTLTYINGQPLTVRPIESRDASLIAALLTRLSEHSCWMRYSCPRLAPEAAQYETQRVLGRDPAQAVALVVTVRQGRAEQAIALAEFVAIDSDIAEVAIVVDDDYQGQGLGRALLCQIVALASKRGLRRLQFDIRRENRAMQALVRSLELPNHCQYGPDEICLWVELTAPVYT